MAQTNKKRKASDKKTRKDRKESEDAQAKEEISLIKNSSGYCLLVIDMQEHFRGIGEDILMPLISLIKFCQTQSRKGIRIPVIFTQHGHHDPTKDSGSLGRWWGLPDCIKYKSSNWHLLEELQELAEPSDETGTYKVDKNRYDAFHGTNLQEILNQENVRSVVVSGVMTNLCCETTARSAFVRDFDVFFLKDCTATASEEFQKATLLNLSYGFATVLSSQAIHTKLKSLP